MIRIFLVLFSLFLTTGCWIKSKQELVSHFSEKISISPDDQRLLLSVYKDHAAAIYEAEINTNSIKRLTNPQNEFHTGPVYSPDASKILFISYPSGFAKPRSQLCIMDSDGDNIVQLSNAELHITEAVFSPDGEYVYYLASSFFGHYSPLVGSNPHDYDVYSVNLTSGQIRMITNLAAYSMRGLSIDPKGNTLAFSLADADFGEESICLLSLDNVHNMSHLRPKKIMGSPQLSPDGNKIAFLGLSGTRGQFYTYDIFLMDLETKELKQLTDLRKSNAFHSFAFYHSKPKMLFMDGWGKSRPKIMQIGLDGSDLKAMELEFNLK